MYPSMLARVFPQPSLIIVMLAVLMLSACTLEAEHTPTANWALQALPDTPAGRQAAAYLAIFNAGDKHALDKFVAENMSPVGPGGLTICSNLTGRSAATSC